MNRKKFLNLLKIIISFSLLFLIWRELDLEQLSSVLLNVNLGWLLMAIALVLLNIIVRARRWQVLLHALRVDVPLKELVTIYFIGSAFNNLLPSGVGGDAIRAVELNQHTDQVSDAVTSVVVDRFLGLYGSLMLGFVTLIFAWKLVPAQVTWISGLVFLAMTGGGLVLVNRPIYHLLRRIPPVRVVTDIRPIHGLFESFQRYPPGALGRAFGVGLIVNGLLIAINIALGVGLGIGIWPVYYLIFVPLVNLTLALPLSVAGFGFREGAYTMLFGTVGVLGETAVALSLLVFMTGNLVPGFMGGIIYLWRSTKNLQLASEKRET